MKKVTVIARETFPYDGIDRRAGESFQANPEDARILVLVGRVVRAPRASAEEPTEAQAGDDAPEPRRRSRRKDIVPEA